VLTTQYSGVRKPDLIKCVLLFCCCPVLSFADETGDEKWGFSLGAFFTSQDVNARFEAGGIGGGDRIDFQADLGLDESLSVFRLGAFYNFNERHSVDFSAFDLSQSAKVTLSKDIEWQDIVFPISVDVATDLDLTIYKAAYTYKLSSKERGFIGVTGGLYVADIGISLTLEATGAGEAGSITAPLPVLGLRGEYYLSERWRAHASAEWFLVDIDNYHGTLQDVLFGIDYRLFEHAAVGLGYNQVQVDIDATEKLLRADLAWNYSGVIAYLQFAF
jgi:hypothetical protein